MTNLRNRLKRLAESVQGKGRWERPRIIVPNPDGSVDNDWVWVPHDQPRGLTIPDYDDRDLDPDLVIEADKPYREHTDA